VYEYFSNSTMPSVAEKSLLVFCAVVLITSATKVSVRTNALNLPLQITDECVLGGRHHPLTMCATYIQAAEHEGGAIGWPEAQVIYNMTLKSM
jgi:hypothetical protein